MGSLSESHISQVSARGERDLAHIIVILRIDGIENLQWRPRGLWRERKLGRRTFEPLKVASRGTAI